MKKTILLFVITGLFTGVHAQKNAIPVMVKDRYLGQPLADTKIIINQSDTLTTDKTGRFDFHPHNNNTLFTIRANGYLPRTFFGEFIATGAPVLLEAENCKAGDIAVRSFNHNKPLLQTPGAITTLASNDLQRNNTTDITQTLNLVPGLRIDARNLNAGYKLIIRGYGTQSSTGNVGYKAYLNDVPLTDGEGNTFIDDIDFATIGRIEVLKGPSSSVYGSGIGGVVQFFSQKAPDGISLRQLGMAGSHGYQRTTTSIGVGNDQSNVLFQYGRLRDDGQRLHSHSKKDFWNINADVYHSQKSTLSVFAGYTQSYDQLAGQVDSLGLITKPDTADLAYITNNSHTEMESIRVGITSEYFFTRNFSNKTTLFLSSLQLDQAVSTILTKNSKSSFGLRSTFVLAPRIGNVDARFILGTEVIKTDNRQQSYTLTNGVTGAVRTNQDFNPFSWNLFAQIDLTVAKNTLMSFGASSNFLEYDIEDERTNQSGYKRFTPLITPRLMLNHLLTQNISVYSGYSMGFVPPATNQVIIAQNGKVNTGLVAETGNSFEVGTRGNFLDHALNVSFSFFNTDVTNKFESQNFPAAGGQVAYTALVNIGVVNHTGLELAVNYAYQPKTKSFIRLVRPFFSYTYNESTNTDLKSDNNGSTATKDYSNLKVSGVSPHLCNGGIDVETGNGFYLNLTDLFTDRMPITLDNTVNADSYNLVNGKLGYRKDWVIARRHMFSVDLFGGVNNIFNARYAQFTVLNLLPVAGVAPKYFTPGMPGTNYFGASIRYTFH